MMSDGRVHGEQRDDLQEMVLHDVSDRADLFVEASATLDAERLSHRHLDASNVLAVPDRLEKRIGKTEIQEVLNRFLAQEMVDAVDRRFVKIARQHLIQRLGAGQVAAERLLDDDPRPARAARNAQLLDHHREQHRRYGQVVDRPLGRAQLAPQGLEGRRAVVIAVDVVQQRAQPLEGCRVDSAVLAQTGLCPPL